MRSPVPRGSKTNNTQEPSGETRGWAAVVTAFTAFALLALAMWISYATDTFVPMGKLFALVGSIVGVFHFTADVCERLSK